MNDNGPWNPYGDDPQSFDDWENQIPQDYDEDWQDNATCGNFNNLNGNQGNNWENPGSVRNNQTENPNGFDYNQFTPDNFDYGQEVDYGEPYQENQKPQKNKRQRKQKAPKEPRRAGCLTRLIIGLLKLLLIIVIIVCAIFFIIRYNNNKKLEAQISEVESSLIVMSPEEYISLKETKDSDIKGFTQEEKLNNGLDPADGSDTDGDGLTDKEEIEIYGTNPLKISTSGDLIPDGYKAKNKLSTSTYYDDPASVGYTVFDQYDNIEILDQTTNNSLMGIKEIDWVIEGVKATKAYKITNYTGKITIDFSKYILNNSKYKILKLEDSLDSTISEVKDKDGVVTLEIDEVGIKIGIVSLEDITYNNSFDLGNTSYSQEGIMIVSPITMLTGEMRVLIFEKSIISTNKPDRSKELTKRLTESLGVPVNVTHEYVDPIAYSIRKTIFESIQDGTIYKRVLSKIVEQTSESESNTNENEETALSFDEMPNYQKVLGLFYIYYNFQDENELLDQFKSESTENSEETIEEVVNSKPSTYISSFDVTKDAFPFKNIATVISPMGNCAGFSQITALLFNGRTVKTTNNQTFGSESYGYDITGYDEFKTLTDRYLYDYKTNSYWTDNYPNLSTLELSQMPNTDREFVKFIGFLWAENNAKSPSNIHCYNNEESWVTVEALKDYFASGDQVCSVSMLCPYGGHNVIAYGMYEDLDDPDVWYILVYDNNFPNHEYDGVKINNTIKVVKQEHFFGEPTFEFDYYPLPSLAPNYRFTSYTTKSKNSSNIRTALQMHELSFCDEMYNGIK